MTKNALSGRSGGGFPNRRSEFQSKFALIMQHLFHQLCRGGDFFVVVVQQKRTGKSENCAKLLKANCGEVAEWLNAAVC